MTRQITVRLPDAQVDFLDTEVAAGHVSSRAAAIAKALRREQRRQLAEHDLKTLLHNGEDAELTSLADWAVRRSYPELD